MFCSDPRFGLALCQMIWDKYDTRQTRLSLKIIWDPFWPCSFMKMLSNWPQNTVPDGLLSSMVFMIFLSGRRKEIWETALVSDCEAMCRHGRQWFERSWEIEPHPCGVPSRKQQREQGEHHGLWKQRDFQIWIWGMSQPWAGHWSKVHIFFRMQRPRCNWDWTTPWISHLPRSGAEQAQETARWRLDAMTRRWWTRSLGTVQGRAQVIRRISTTLWLK